MANYGYNQGPMGPNMGMGHQMIGPQVPMMPPPPPPSNMDPASNNQPLQFNMNKGKPPMAMNMPMDGSEGHMGQDMDNKNKVDMDLDSKDDDYRNGNMMNNMGGSGGSNQGNNMQMMGQWGGPMMGPMMGDPSGMMMGGAMGQWGGPMGMNMGMIGGMSGGLVDPSMPRQPIKLANETTVYPPSANAPPPTTRERPPGCKTIFVGGLPETITEEVLQEMFEKCGSIISIRLSKKNFAHLRFTDEMAVDKALMVSGWRLKIENKDDKPNTGRIHVDYAQAKDDLYEWECNQRALAREMRHRQRVEEARLRPPSPPPVTHFSDHEATLMLEKLKGDATYPGDETFTKSTETLIAWMIRGDCSRRSSNMFYSMIQSVNAHVRRLTHEKEQYNMEYEETKQTFRSRLEGILRQMEQIDKVFVAATKQKAWDHFTKAQRKNLDTWRKMASEIRQKEEQEFLKERKEDEMEMSEEEGEPASKKKKQGPGLADAVEWRNLKEENNTLKFQIEAFKNEVELLKTEAREPVGSTSSDDVDKEKQIKLLQRTLQGMQQQLMSAKKDLRDREQEMTRKLDDLEYDNDKLKRENTKLQSSQVIQIDGDKDHETARRESKEERDAEENGEETEKESVKETPSSSSSAFTDREARLVGLMSTFLHVHPFGASVDYIWSYLDRLQIKIRTSEIEDLLEKCPSVFKQDVSGVGAAIERRWIFIGFNPYV